VPFSDEESGIALGEVVQFCLELEGTELPQKYIRVESIARYDDTVVSVRAVEELYIPDFLFFTTVNF